MGVLFNEGGERMEEPEAAPAKEFSLDAAGSPEVTVLALRQARPSNKLKKGKPIKIIPFNRLLFAFNIRLTIGGALLYFLFCKLNSFN